MHCNDPVIKIYQNDIKFNCVFKFIKVEPHLAEMKTDENRWWRHYNWHWHWSFGLTLKFDKNEVWAVLVITLYVQISYLCYKKGTQVTHYSIKFTVEGFKVSSSPRTSNISQYVHNYTLFYVFKKIALNTYF